jgi:hypothetical protein
LYVSAPLTLDTNWTYCTVCDSRWTCWTFERIVPWNGQRCVLKWGPSNISLHDRLYLLGIGTKDLSLWYLIMLNYSTPSK